MQLFRFPGGLFWFLSGFFAAEKFVGFLEGFWRPEALLLEVFEFVELFYADDGSAFGEFVAAQKWASFALADNQFAAFVLAALVALDACGFGWRFGRQDIALLVDLEDGFAIGIIAAA